MILDVGIGEYVISNDSNAILKTYALGSCVSLVLWNKGKDLAGLSHFALPESSVNEEKAKIKPAYFIDSGLPIFLEEFKKKGGILNSAITYLVGGSSILDVNRTFDIGRRNVIAVKKVLWKYGLGVIKADVGGNISRTVAVPLATGEVLLSNSQKKWKL